MPIHRTITSGDELVTLLTALIERLDPVVDMPEGLRTTFRCLCEEVMMRERGLAMNDHDVGEYFGAVFSDIRSSLDMPRVRCSVRALDAVSLIYADCMDLGEDSGLPFEGLIRILAEILGWEQRWFSVEKKKKKRFLINSEDCTEYLGVEIRIPLPVLAQ